jgi:hypothetical protein
MTSPLKLALAAFALLAAVAAPFAASAHVNQPQEIIERPRTLPGAELELDAGVDLDYTSVTVNNMTTTNTGIRAPLAIGYGLNNDLDLHLLYGILLRPTVTGKQPLEVRLGYTFLGEGPLTAAARVMSGIDLASNTATPLRLGVNAQYQVMHVALFTPGEQLSASLSGSPERIGLDLPVGAALQATATVYLALTTNLAHINIANEGNAFILRDMIPLSAVAFFSPSNALDLGAHLDIDLKATDHFVIGVLARFFM